MPEVEASVKVVTQSPSTSTPSTFTISGVVVVGGVTVWDAFRLFVRTLLFPIRGVDLVVTHSRITVSMSEGDSILRKKSD